MGIITAASLALGLGALLFTLLYGLAAMFRPDQSVGRQRARRRSF